MLRVILAMSLTAFIGLTACAPKEEAPPPAAPKYLARSQQMYAGQDMIDKIDTGTIAVGQAGTLNMKVSGSVPAAGYTKQAFLKRINAYPPKDGVYEVDVVANKPAVAGAAVVTPIEVKGAWEPYPADRLKGVRFISKTNSVVAMLPAG